MRHRLVAENTVPGLHVIGLNSRHWPGQLMLTELANDINFTIYQSTHKNDLWSRLGAMKDDILVYDRCGNLAYYLSYPRSHIAYRFVEAAVLSAYHDSPCGTCPVNYQQPANCTAPTVETSTSRNSRQNVVDDSACAEFDERKCANSSMKHRQHGATATWRLHAHCCRLLAQRQAAERSGRRRCLCLPSGEIGSSSQHEDSCLCRSEVTNNTSCFCSLARPDLHSSCHCHPLTTPRGVLGARSCTCHNLTPTA